MQFVNNEEYDIAIYNADTDTLKKYKLVDGQYVHV